MVSLQKMYVARFFADDKHPFTTERVVAKSFHEAVEKAEDWAEVKYTDRKVRDIVVERSKGEVVA